MCTLTSYSPPPPLSLPITTPLNRLIAWELSYLFHLDDFWMEGNLWHCSSFQPHSYYFRVHMLLFKLVLLLLFIFCRVNLGKFKKVSYHSSPMFSRLFPSLMSICLLSYFLLTHPSHYLFLNLLPPISFLYSGMQAALMFACCFIFFLRYGHINRPFRCSSSNNVCTVLLALLVINTGI